MRDDDSPLGGGPIEKRLIIDAGQPNVLNSDDIEIGLSTEQASNDVVVEVLVGGQADHDRLLFSREKTVADAGRIEAPFVLLASLVRFLAALREIGGDFRAMAQIVGDNGIDIRQGQ